MRRLLFLVFTLECVFQVHAQNNKTVSGQILDEISNAPVEYAAVSISDADSNLITGNITDADGRFVLAGLPSGEYTLNVSFVGYKPLSQKIRIGQLNNNYDIGKIHLFESAVNLESVTITADRNEVASAMDKKTYSMDDLISQSGGSLLDAMKTMPGVTVDQEGKVILRGSDKVIILIDGRQSALTGIGNQKSLDNIPSANIESIEIINNPSAKYDASGMAGIINIVYKKEKQEGFTGNVSFAYALGALTKAKPDLKTDLGSYSTNPKYITGIDLNYNSKKVGFFLQSEMYTQKALPNNEFTTRYYDDGRTIVSQVPENRTQNHYIVKGGMDYHLSSSTTMSISGIYDWERHQDTAQVAYINMSDNTRNRYINWHEDEITGFMNFAVKLVHNFPQPGHQINAILQYTKNWEDETYYINDSSSIRQGRDVTAVLGTEHIAGFNLDYAKPLRTGRLETGARMQIRNLPVDYSVQRDDNSIIYAGMGEWTRWGESIYAAYLNWIHEKQKYDIEGGIRTEYTAVFYKLDESNIYYPENDAYDYFDFFPNVRLTYKINQNNRISAFYNRRIDRPGEPELRIFAKSDDHELVKVGNPYLRPQFTQSVEAAYKKSWKTGSVFISLYYRLIRDSYIRVYTIDESNSLYDIVLKSYANTGNSTNKGVEIVFSQRIAPFWRLNGNMNLYRNQINSFTGYLDFPYRHPFVINETFDNTWDSKLSNLFNPAKNLEIQISGLYYAPKNIPQGKQFSRSSIDLGAKYLIQNGKAEVNFSFSDIFNKYGIKQEIESDGIRAVYQNYYETQVVRAGVKYKF